MMTIDKTKTKTLSMNVSKKNRLLVLISDVNGKANSIIFNLFYPETVLVKRIIELYFKRTFATFPNGFTIKIAQNIAQNIDKYSLYIHIIHTQKSSEFSFLVKTPDDKNSFVFTLSFQDLLRVLSYSEASIQLTLANVKLQNVLWHLQNQNQSNQNQSQVSEKLINEDEVKENETPFSIPNVEDDEIPFD